MSIKLNKYSIPDDTINQMKASMHKSRQIKSEVGFTLCADKEDNLQARNVCTGDRCHIVNELVCNEGEKFTGTYHTHPGSFSMASASDLVKCGIMHHICISGQKDNKTRCYIWQHGPMTGEKYDEFVGLHDKGIRQIDNPVYEKNFECMKEFVQLTSIEHEILERNKILNEQNQELQRAKQEKAPKHVIKEMEKDLKYNLEYGAKIVSDIRKKTAELIPKYYKEKILW